MITTYFEGLVLDISVECFTSCLSVMDGNHYLPTKSNTLNEYLLMKNFFYPSGIKVKLVEDNKYNIKVSSFYDGEYNKDAFKLLRTVFEKIGGSSYTISTDYNDIVVKETFEKGWPTNYYVDIEANYSTNKLLSLVEAVQKNLLGSSVVPEDDDFENIINKFVKKNANEKLKGFMKEGWRKDVAVKFGGAQPMDYFGHKTNIFFFRQYLYSQHGWASMEEFKEAKDIDIQSYFSFVKATGLDEKAFNKYTAGVEDFVTFVKEIL